MQDLQEIVVDTAEKLNRLIDQGTSETVSEYTLIYLTMIYNNVVECPMLQNYSIVSYPKIQIIEHIHSIVVLYSITLYKSV